MTQVVVKAPHLLSDLHLDLYTNASALSALYRNVLGDITASTETADVRPMILAGDIASVHTIIGRERWVEFVGMLQQRRYDPILVVMGNHEHYGGDYRETARLLKETVPSITLLQQDVWEPPTADYVIVGCTLWSHIPSHVKSLIALFINDYVQINDFTTTVSNTLHDSDRQWLETTLQRIQQDGKRKKIIAVTHHAPLLDSGCSNEQYVGRPTNHAFETHLPELVKYADTWCFGHTHWSTDFMVKYDDHETRIVSNAHGYKNEKGSRDHFVIGKEI